MLKLKVQKQIILDSPSLPWYAETNISKKGGGRYAPYVSFWHSGEDYAMMTEDEFEDNLQNTEMTIGGM